LHNEERRELEAYNSTALRDRKSHKKPSNAPNRNTLEIGSRSLAITYNP
jgi:hypothetical protein